MKYKWLSKKNCNKLIVFFNGWGMDEAVVEHLDCEDYDVVMFYDYNNLDTDFPKEIFNKYEVKHLLSWSMGVMTATLFITKDEALNFNSTVAINGTLKPIDENFGINPKIYDLTIRGFNEDGRKKFVQNMFNPSREIVLNRNQEEQKSELLALKNYKAKEDFKYTKVLISDCDKIIPSKNQVKYWETNANLQAGHCPFFSFKKWSELI